MMPRIKKTLAITGILVLLIMIAVQFIPRMERNSGAVGADAITAQYEVPKKVQAVLRKACFDCHSNNTDYPWYSDIQPFARFMEGHIIQGKEALNLDEFGSYSTKKQYNKLRSLESQLQDGTMPLKSYLIMHRDARLTSGEVSLLIDWSRELRNKMDLKM